MAYNDKRLKTDLEGKPIPQAYNPDIDDYEPVHSTNNALNQVIYGPNGQPISTVGNKLAVRATELEALMQGLATEGKLEQVRQLLAGVASELATIKANQLSGDQKVQLSGTIFGADISDRPPANSVPVGTTFVITNAELDAWISNGTDWVVI